MLLQSLCLVVLQTMDAPLSEAAAKLTRSRKSLFELTNHSAQIQRGLLIAPLHGPARLLPPGPLLCDGNAVSRGNAVIFRFDASAAMWKRARRCCLRCSLLLIATLAW